MLKKSKPGKVDHWISLTHGWYLLLAWLRWFNLLNLQPLVNATPASTPMDPAPIRMGLVNARSVTNMMFILKDYFASQGLCVMEMWISPGESSTCSVLLPCDCTYFNPLESTDALACPNHMTNLRWYSSRTQPRWVSGSTCVKSAEVKLYASF